MLDGPSDLGGAGGLGVLRLHDCKERNRSAQDDRFAVGWAEGRFFLFGKLRVGMTTRKAKAKATPKRRLEVGGWLEVDGLALEDLLDNGMDVEQRPWRSDLLRLGLAGLVDDDGGARVEGAVGGGAIFGGPGGLVVPEIGTPGVVALDDQRGVLPAR